MLDFFSSKNKKHHHKQHHDRHDHHDEHHHSHHHHHQPSEEGSLDSPILSPNDEAFLERIVSQDDNNFLPPSPPPLHMPGEPQLQEAGDPLGNEADRLKDAQRGTTSFGDRNLDDDEDTKEKHKKHDGHDKHSEKAKNKWSLQRFTPKKKSAAHAREHGMEDGTVTPKEAAREKDDLAAVLNRLSLSTAHSRTLSLSKESRELVQRFNLILKDIVNGAPTAYDDLVQLFDSSEDHLEKSYRHLPPHLQKLVKTLPKKLSKDIVPELLAGGAAAEVASKEHAGGKAKNSAVQMPNLKDLIIKQGAISALLKSVMNVLKLRFPAFMGTSALWSLGVFVLLLALWYCHKRGREVRLAKEKLAIAAGELRDEDRFEVLEDDTSDEDATSGAHSGSRKLLPPP